MIQPSEQAKELLKGVKAAAAKVGPRRRAFLNPGRVVCRIDRILFEESKRKRGVWFYKVEMTVAKQLCQSPLIFPDYQLGGKTITGRADPLNHEGQEVIYQMNRTWENFDEKMAQFLIRASGAAASEISDDDPVNAMQSAADGGLVGSFVEIDIRADVVTPKDKNEIPYPWSTVDFIGPVTPDRLLAMAKDAEDGKRLQVMLEGK